MILAALALGALLERCATNIAPRTMAAVVSVESGGNSLALHDNTVRQSFDAPDRATAVAWATQLIGMGHSVDMGLSQINSENLPSLGLSVRAAFDPCENLHAGATILGNDYANASAHFGPGQYALRRALSAYNSGSMFAAQDYVDRILVAAGVPPDPEPAVAHVRPPRAKAAAVTAIATPTPPYTQSIVQGSPVLVINGNP